MTLRPTCSAGSEWNRRCRAGDDRRTYRLDAESLKQAALDVGPPRDAGLALGAADEDEKAVLRHYFVNGRLRLLIFA